jgi:hypothetical protein
VLGSSAWLGLFNKQCHEREMADELESHLQLHIEDNLRAGMTSLEARLRALIKLGSIEQTKEMYRDRQAQLEAEHQRLPRMTLSAVPISLNSPRRAFNLEESAIQRPGPGPSDRL